MEQTHCCKEATAIKLHNIQLVPKRLHSVNIVSFNLTKKRLNHSLYNNVLVTIL